MERLMPLEKESAKLLDHIIEIKHTLGGLEAKIDSLDEKIEQHLIEDRAALKSIDTRLTAIEVQSTESATVLDVIQPQLTQHDKRISGIERKHSWIMGVGAAIAFVIGAVLGLFRPGGHQ